MVSSRLVLHMEWKKNWTNQSTVLIFTQYFPDSILDGAFVRFHEPRRQAEEYSDGLHSVAEFRLKTQVLLVTVF